MSETRIPAPLSAIDAADAFEDALLFVLRRLDQPISPAALRSRVAKLPGPWALDDITEAAESLGLAVERYDFDVLARRWTHFPTVMPLRSGGVAVVLAQPSDGEVEVYRPGQGLRTEAVAEFAHEVQPLAVVFSRAVRATVEGDAPQGRYGHWFFGPLLKAKRLYVQVGIAVLMINIFALTTSIFSMIVYDRVIPNNAIDTLIALLIGAGVVFISDFIIRSLRGYFLDVAGARADMVIGDTLFEQVLDMQMAARKGSTGSVANVLKEFESLREFLTSTTLVTLIDIPFSILFLVVIWSIGGPMVWVPLLAIPLMVGAGLFVQPRMRRLVQASQEDGHRKHAVLIETLGGIETIKSLGAGALMRHRWQQAVTHQSELGLKQRMWSSFAANIANLSQQFVQVGVVTMGFFLIGQGQIGFGAIIACTILSGRAISPLAQLTQLLTRVNQSLASYKSLSQLMSQPREHAADAHFVARNHLQGSIEFRNVSFTYPGAAKPALNNVSFKIEAGERVAILGKIGSGKTTIAKLILGLYKPEEGAVLIDGVDVRQIDPADLRRNVGAVLQDVWLMSGTLRENIALGADLVNDDAMLRAAQIAGVEDFASQHPHGYGMRVGERGEGLSGGQRQAVSIARALVSNPPLWVFDEPSSAMDSAAEVQLVERLRGAVEGHTFVVITHKSTMVGLVNKVIVIDQGKVAFFGSPDKVLGSGRG